MTSLKLIITTAILVFVTGCVSPPQQPISFSEDFWKTPEIKIGIVATETPEIDVFLPGASCLLCMAVAEAANSDISKLSKSFSTDDLSDIKQQLFSKLQLRGIESVIINEDLETKELPKYSSKDPNTAKKDFKAYSEKYEITHLLVVDIAQLGLLRSYASYVPTSDPKGLMSGKSYIIDLNNNTYSWYLPIQIHKSVNDEWDEPPTFPALTNAYYQAIETGKEKILELF